MTQVSFNLNPRRCSDCGIELKFHNVYSLCMDCHSQFGDEEKSLYREWIELRRRMDIQRGLEALQQAIGRRQA